MCSKRSRGKHTGNRLANLTPEQLVELKLKKQTTWKNKSKEEREEYAMRLNEIRSNFSEEKKASIRKKKQESWNRKSKEEKTRIIESTK